MKIGLDDELLLLQNESGTHRKAVLKEAIQPISPSFFAETVVRALEYTVQIHDVTSMQQESKRQIFEQRIHKSEHWLAAGLNISYKMRVPCSVRKLANNQKDETEM